MDLDEIVEVFGALSAIASTEGIMALTEFEAIMRRDESDKLLGAGLAMVIDGQGGDLTDDILEKRKRILVQQLETRCNMVIEGVMNLHGGLLEQPMRAQLAAHYSLSHDCKG